MERWDRKKAGSNRRFAHWVGRGKNTAQRVTCGVESKVSSLKIQVNCGERQVGWWQVKCLNSETNRDENKKGSGSHLCALIAYTFEFRARLLWNLYKWG